MRLSRVLFLSVGVILFAACGDSSGTKSDATVDTTHRRDGGTDGTTDSIGIRDSVPDGLFDGPADGRGEGPIERFDGGDGPHESTITPDGPDAALDATNDAPDSSVDATNDAPDSSVDATNDAPDSSVDSSVDATDDAPDSTVDASADATNDAIDSSVDSTADTSRDFPASPLTFYWADWTSSTNGTPGSAAGTISPTSGNVTISYAGEVTFAQTSGGTNYWNPGAPYINQLTQNAPPAADIIAMTGPSTGNTITFNPPVHDLVMAIVSLGTPSKQVTYTFNVPITLLSYGAGYWGNGTLTQTASNAVSGAEGHGAITFRGTISQLTWSVSTNEYWHGFTIGIPDQ